MLLRTFVVLVILGSIGVGVLALTLPREQLVHVIMFRDFFDVSLPILAFGALVKYLCQFKHRHHHHHWYNSKGCPQCGYKGDHAGTDHK
jgi:hypothetical protein